MLPRSAAHILRFSLASEGYPSAVVWRSLIRLQLGVCKVGGFLANGDFEDVRRRGRKPHRRQEVY